MAATTLAHQATEAKDLLQEVVQQSGQPLTACYQCRRCAAGCPVGEDTGNLTPDRLIRMIIFGDRDTAINNELVWKCVSCYTCGTRCPNDIQTARITETLKKLAQKAHQTPLQPQVANFHHAFVTSGVRWGRINEVEFMSSYEFRNIFGYLKNLQFNALYSEIKAPLKLAVGMLKRKRMHFGFQTAKGRKELKRLFQRGKQRLTVSK